MPRLGVAAALLVLALTSACSPRLAPNGGGSAVPMLSDRHLVTESGVRMPLRVWLPPLVTAARAVIVAVHGFNDYSNAFAMPAPWLAERGIAVYAYDQRGFGATEDAGLWPGSEVLASDLKTALALVAERHRGTPLYVLGESMGGSIVIAALANNPDPPVAGAILVAPATWGRAVMPLYQRVALWLAAHTVPWLKLTARGLGIRPSDNIEMLQALSRDPLVIKATRVDALWGIVDLMDRALADARGFKVRALLLYGQRDEVILPAGTRLLADRLPLQDLRVGVYANGFHMLLRDNQREVVWRDIAAWITDPAQPLPSGADRAPPAG